MQYVQREAPQKLKQTRVSLELLHALSTIKAIKHCAREVIYRVLLITGLK